MRIAHISFRTCESFEHCQREKAFRLSQAAQSGMQFGLRGVHLQWHASCVALPSIFKGAAKL